MPLYNNLEQEYTMVDWRQEIIGLWLFFLVSFHSVVNPFVFAAEQGEEKISAFYH